MKAKFGGRSPGSNDETGKRSVSQKRAQWLAPEHTPFAVPVLDLIAITGQMLSTSQDPNAATRLLSWPNSVGEELDASGLAKLEPLACALRYPADPSLADGLLFTPKE